MLLLAAEAMVVFQSDAKNLYHLVDLMAVTVVAVATLF
jgi:hypothetical protein